MAGKKDWQTDIPMKEEKPLEVMAAPVVEVNQREKKLFNGMASVLQGIEGLLTAVQQDKNFPIRWKNQILEIQRLCQKAMAD